MICMEKSANDGEKYQKCNRNIQAIKLIFIVDLPAFFVFLQVAHNVAKCMARRLTTNTLKYSIKGAITATTMASEPTDFFSNKDITKSSLRAINELSDETCIFLPRSYVLALLYSAWFRLLSSLCSILRRRVRRSVDSLCATAHNFI